MTYFPQSQIKTNLHTNVGSFVLKSSKSPYSGYYWKTSTGKFFSGKNPNEKPSNELIAVFDPENESIIPNQTLPTSILVSGETNYTTPKNITYENSSKSIPINIINNPTVSDYKLGEFRRYFCKKTNELIYIEINKDTYDKLVKRDKSMLWELYTPFNISWTLIGDIEKVYLTNKNMVNLIIYRLNLIAFNQFLKDDYLKFFK